MMMCMVGIEAGLKIPHFDYDKFEMAVDVRSVWNKKKLLEEQKESIFVTIDKKGEKTDCSNYRDTTLQLTTYEILPDMQLSRLTPCAEEIIGDRQCGFRCERSTTDQIFLCVLDRASL